eukprot:TRINITY_DN17896_c0_g1_i1.p1 TRINITY_DN17896_c0_g1~~TRINITY_DN17896_c0_g1_i1.p1  ORF type:complete len:462 (+),score=127.46 TRINITY_DN17896_c0_g1_i1:116-1501(+)
MFWQRRTDTSMGCPAVGRRELEHQQRMHRDKIRSMKSAIDTKAPTSQPHLTLYGRDYVAKKRATTEAAFSDLKMIQSIARTMTRSADIPERKGPISLTASSRKAEIYGIMRENHRLLNSLENLQPVTKTVDFERQNQWRQRYVINCSHSKRLSGEYDRDIEKIHVEDEAKMKKYRSSVDMRRSAAQRMAAGGGSSSMPSLTPMGSVSQNDQMSSSAPAGTVASPPVRQNRGKVGPSTTPKTGAMGSSSSSSGSRPANKPVGGQQGVRFDAPEGTGEGSDEKTPGTPYPNKSISEMAKEGNDDHELLVVDDKICVVMQPDATSPTSQASPGGGATSGVEARVDDAAPAEEEDEWAAALMGDGDPAPAADESTATYSKEFDPSSMAHPADTSSATADGAQGAGSAPASPSKGGEDDDDYEEDFADESMTATGGKSAPPKAERPKPDASFEEESEFEQSATSDK